MSNDDSTVREDRRPHASVVPLFPEVTPQVKGGDTTLLRRVLQGEHLPRADEVGHRAQDWTLPIVASDCDLDSILPGYDTTLWFRGLFIGMGSTQQYRHRPTHTPPETWSNPIQDLKCNACRWFELRIFYDENAECYILHFGGRSIVPGESQRFRYERAYTAYEVIDILTSRREDNSQYLTLPTSRALAQAAGFDDDMHEAYTARRAAL